MISFDKLTSSQFDALTSAHFDPMPSVYTPPTIYDTVAAQCYQSPVAHCANHAEDCLTMSPDQFASMTTNAWFDLPVETFTFEAAAAQCFAPHAVAMEVIE